LRRRFADVLLLTASFVVFASASVAICNASVLTVWLKGEVAWPWHNDVLMAVLIIFNCISRCYIGLAGYAKEVKAMRWIYFLEGASFVVAAFLTAPHLGLSGIILMAIIANIVWSGNYGVRWAAPYLGASPRKLFFDWLRPAARYLLVLAPITAGLWLVTFRLPPWQRLAVDAATMAVVGLSLLWLLGLTPRLRDEFRRTIRRPLGDNRSLKATL